MNDWGKVTQIHRFKRAAIKTSGILKVNVQKLGVPGDEKLIAIALFANLIICKWISAAGEWEEYCYGSRGESEHLRSAGLVLIRCVLSSQIAGWRRKVDLVLLILLIFWWIYYLFETEAAIMVWIWKLLMC